MLYRPIWFLCIFIYRVFFKNFFVNYQQFDLKRPTIIVSNHNNAFIDPIIFPALILQRLYFVVRGDIFNTPLKHWALWNMGQIPMFRIRDGIDNVKKNDKSFEQIYDLLAKKQNIVIFPEGDCVQEKRIRGLKRGTARMAFGSVLKHGWDIDVQLLPVLNNYTYPKEFRTEVMLNVGKPILLSDYKELYLENENKALAKLTDDIHAVMKVLYIHIDNKEDDELFEKIVILKRNNKSRPSIPWRINGIERFEMEKGLADSLNALDAETKGKLHEKAISYLEALKNYNVSDAAVNGITPNAILGLLIAIIGFPLYTIGILLNIFQFQFAQKLVAKKIRQVNFKNSIRYGVLLIINLLIALTFMIVFSSIHWALIALIPLGLMMLAFFTVNYHEYVQGWLETKNCNKLIEKDFEQLKSMRTELLQGL